ncbi:MAG TPA: urease accessory protein UreD [Ramlibacter sp.]|uniref:urease accessory protein UreD n=1 Tax=Ramlibacter sp. TaxID=1917967 RepID=UPI002C3BCAFF|nr:urease accessory protein UreD [Ramlibacter sp.]HVZ45128.1 urease accessory protein UreD [Ramlibacter sp.]
MPWNASIRLAYAASGEGRTIARFAHEGPLRILQSLHPEGAAICHNVLVHPPGGLVGGDTLEVDVSGQERTHGLITTPGAARFYRSEGEAATQIARIRLAQHARLEWLPLEAIYYPGCDAVNRLELDLAPGGEAFGWDIAALGLPQANQPFARGRVRQHIELRGDWLERASIDARDARLLDGPLGFAGHRCLATLFFATGSDMPRARRELALDAAREAIERDATHRDGAETSTRACIAGATSPSPRVVVVRALAPLVEPAFGVLKAVHRAWRPALWGLPPVQPRSWTV